MFLSLAYLNVPQILISRGACDETFVYDSWRIIHLLSSGRQSVHIIE